MWGSPSVALTVASSSSVGVASEGGGSTFPLRGLDKLLPASLTGQFAPGVKVPL